MRMVFIIRLQLLQFLQDVDRGREVLHLPIEPRGRAQGIQLGGLKGERFFKCFARFGHLAGIKQGKAQIAPGHRVGRICLDHRLKKFHRLSGLPQFRVGDAG